MRRPRVTGYRFSRFFGVEGGLGLLFLDDETPLSLQVRNTDTGEINQEESDELGFTYHLALRGEVPLGGQFSAFGLLGYKGFQFNRDIDDCDNCPSDEIALRGGGLYGGGVGWGDIHHVELKFQGYTGDDVDPQVILGYQFRR